MAKEVHMDDHLVAQIVRQFFESNKHHEPQTKMTACFNITLCLLQIFSIGANKRELRKIASAFHKGMKEEIESLYLYEDK